MVSTHSSWGIRSSMSTSPLTAAISVRRSSANFSLHLQGLVLDDGQPPALAGQDDLQSRRCWACSSSSSSSIFMTLQPGKLAQLALARWRRPARRRSRSAPSGRLGFGPAALAGPRMMAMISSIMSMAIFRALQNVGALLGLFQVELGAAGDHVQLEVDVLLQNLPQVQEPWARRPQWPA